MKMTKILSYAEQLLHFHSVMQPDVCLEQYYVKVLRSIYLQCMTYLELL